MKRMGQIAWVAVLSAASFAVIPAARGSIIEISSTGTANGGGGNSSGGLEFNNTFTANTALVVDQLGFWDQDGDGLNIAHAAELWDVTSMTLLGSVTVPAGTTAPLGGQSATDDTASGFRFASLSVPILLTAGSQYDVQTYGFNDTNFSAKDPYGDSGNTIVSSADITLDKEGYSFTSASAFHGNDNNAPASNFFAVGSFTTAVPEPASLLGVMGMLSLGMLARRRRRTV